MKSLTDNLSVFAAYNPNITVNMMRAFLFVATKMPCPQSDLAEFLNTSGTTTSRIVSWWCTEDAGENTFKPMMNRMELKSDRRQKLLNLTAEGEQLLRKLQA